MSNTLTVGLLQAAFSSDMDANIAQVKDMIRQAADQGAQVILPPELYQGEYFCKTQDAAHFARAYPALEHPCVTALQPLAQELQVAIPVSIYEKNGPEYYNSIVMLDADGSALGIYRKTHIPDGPGYQEKFYFKPGNTGFKVWQTRYGRIGVGICWDQWFPEAARAMALMGAEVLMYPTAIGSEPQDPSLDTAARWRRCMQGHSVANVIPVVAANRVGNEDGQVFYGTSFITDHTGEVVQDLDRTQTGVIVSTFDRGAIEGARASWGVFRDRRPEEYGPLL